MKATAGIFGLLVAVAGAVMMGLGFMAQLDLRNDSARSAYQSLGLTCRPSQNNANAQECTWGSSYDTRGEDTTPVREHTSELDSDGVLIGAALFVGGLALTAGALAAGGRKATVTSVSAPQLHHSAPPPMHQSASPQMRYSAPQWPGAS